MFFSFPEINAASVFRCESINENCCFAGFVIHIENTGRGEAATGRKRF